MSARRRITCCCAGFSNLRLAVVSPFVDRQHGTERVLAELLTHLVEKYGCVVHLYSQRASGLDLELQDAAKGTRQSGIYWHRIPALPGPHLLQFLSWLVLNKVCRWWHEQVRGAHSDVLLSPGINCFDADVIVVHALFQRVWELAKNKPGRTRSLRDWHRRAYYQLLVALEKRIYGNPEVALGAVSQRTANLLESNFGRRDVRVLPNAVDLQAFSPPQRMQRRAAARGEWKFAELQIVLLLIGNDWSVKGLGTLLRAMAETQNENLHLLVAGSDAQGPFQQLANQLGIADRVRWVRPRADVLSLYAAADIYVSPTREDAFALPPLEAMACGLPVITSVFNGGAEVINDWVNGFILGDPGDVHGLAELLKRLSADEDLRARVGEMAAQAAQACTWERNATKTWEFLNDVARAKILASGRVMDTSEIP
jgi:UDP-glucose:(heptosyl)LPS alpha-1,3-glucosyltransferase